MKRNRLPRSSSVLLGIPLIAASLLSSDSARAVCLLCPGTAIEPSGLPVTISGHGGVTSTDWYKYLLQLTSEILSEAGYPDQRVWAVDVETIQGTFAFIGPMEPSLAFNVLNQSNTYSPVWALSVFDANQDAFLDLLILKLEYQDGVSYLITESWPGVDPLVSPQITGAEITIGNAYAFAAATEVTTLELDQTAATEMGFTATLGAGTYQDVTDQSNSYGIDPLNLLITFSTVSDDPQSWIDSLIVDSDLDGWGDAEDNCLDVYNPDQYDMDGDSAGDACDVCPDLPDLQDDTDGDGTGDACDICPLDPQDDADSDGICGDLDACPNTVFPDGVPVSSLGRSRYADVTGDGVFDTNSRNRVVSTNYTYGDTAGCSCGQILAAAGGSASETADGCTSNTLTGWISTH